MTTSRYFSSTATLLSRDEAGSFSRKLSDGAATERFGAFDVVGSISEVSGSVKALCGAGVTIAVPMAAMTAERPLQPTFLIHYFAAARTQPCT